MSRKVERELPWSWHRSPRWRGHLDRVRRWHDRLMVATRPVDVEDFSYAFFQACHSLWDWLPEGEFPPDQVSQFVNNSIELRLCRDLSNMTKHFELSRPPATAREPSIAREYVGSERGWFADDSVLVVLSQGRKFDMRELATRCLRLWEEYLAKGG